MSKKERKKLFTEQLRLEILRTAIINLEKYSEDNISMRKVAEDIGYTVPIIYEYFEDKQDLIKNVKIQLFINTINDLQDMLRDVQDKESRLWFMLLGYCDFAITNPQLYHCMYQSSTFVHGPDFIEQANQVRSIARDILHDVLQDYQCVMNKEDAIDLVQCFLHGLVTFYHAQSMPPQSDEALLLLHKFIQTCFNGWNVKIKVPNLVLLYKKYYLLDK